ncbi:MAG: hypothetical protein ABI718_11755 [Acidobacteriota bacterium]
MTTHFLLFSTSTSFTMVAVIRSLVPLFLSVLLSATAMAQCDFRSVYGGAYRESALDASVDGNDLWVATSFGVTLFDRSVSPPRAITSIAIPGTTSHVEAAGILVYAASGSSVYAIRKSGRALQIAGSINLALPINDLLYLPPYLYAATSTGVLQLDLLNPVAPVVATHLNTSAGPALRLANIGAMLYVADGDNTVDVYTLQIAPLPQKVGEFNALSQNLAVTAVGDRLYVSDGSRTNVFSGGGSSPAFVGIANGLPSLFAFGTSGGALFTAGSDRRLRVLDYLDPARPVTLVDTEVPFTAGTINRIESITGAGNSVYVAAGDAGLITYDVRDFKAPFPLRVNPVEGATSVFSLGNVVVSSAVAGGLRRYSQNEAGVLTLTAQWPQSGGTWVVQDGAGTRVLASSGPTLTLWDIGTTPPASIRTDSFASPIASAILLSGSAYAVLGDHSIWKVDLSSGAGAPVRVALSDASPSLIGRGGVALGMADLTAAGTTIIRYFASGDPASSSIAATLEGSATSGLAISSDGRAAVTTFRGLQIVDFRSGSPSSRVVPGTDTNLYSDIQITGSDVFLLTSNTLEIRDLNSGELKKEFLLPGSPGAFSYSVDGGQIVSIAAADGILSVKALGETTQPLLLDSPRAERYFRKIKSSGRQLLLTDGRSIDVMLVASDGLPGPRLHIVTSATPADVTAIDGIVYAISTSGRLTGYGSNGTVVADTQINEGSDLVASSLTNIGGALYAGVTRGCLSGGCEKKTIIFQVTGGGLVQTAELAGALVDAAVSGSRAFAIFDTPDEVRVLNIGDPFHPVVLGTRVSEGKPVSIDYSTTLDTIYALGDRLYGYSSVSLTKTAELLDPYTADLSGRLSYLDQTVRIFGNCAIVAGRSFQPSIFSIAGVGQWDAVSSPPVPAAVRSIVVIEGRIYLLTDYSIEIWSTAAIPGRRRPI